MTNSNKPIRNPQIMMQQLYDEMMLYNIQTEEVHILNPTAKLIWELSDGTHTIKQITQAMQQHFRVPSPHNLHHDIEQTVIKLANLGVLRV